MKDTFLDLAIEKGFPIIPQNVCIIWVIRKLCLFLLVQAVSFSFCSLIKLEM